MNISIQFDHGERLDAVRLNQEFKNIVTDLWTVISFIILVNVRKIEQLVRIDTRTENQVVFSGKLILNVNHSLVRKASMHSLWSTMIVFIESLQVHETIAQRSCISV